MSTQVPSKTILHTTNCILRGKLHPLVDSHKRVAKQLLEALWLQTKAQRTGVRRKKSPNVVGES